MTTPTMTSTWPSLSDAPALYPDARNRVNRGPLVYRAGKCFPLSGPFDAGNRAPLLAVGSNAYPRQLSDKLDGSEADLQGIPMVPTILRGFDVAFCPVRSRKGYVPVTLAARPGAVCLTWTQWLTRDQLNIISATEGSRYALVGSEELASAAQLPSYVNRPKRIYAWWFDALLACNNTALWLDVYHRPERQQNGLDPRQSEQIANPIPHGWRIVARDGDDGAFDVIVAENMSELC